MIRIACARVASLAALGGLLLTGGCVTVNPGLPDGAPSASFQFEKGYRANAFMPASTLYFAYVPETCEGGLVAMVSGSTASSKTTRLWSDRPIHLLATTIYTQGQTGSGAYGAEYTPLPPVVCQTWATFIPETGSAYVIRHNSRVDGPCDLTVSFSNGTTVPTTVTEAEQELCARPEPDSGLSEESQPLSQPPS